MTHLNEEQFQQLYDDTLPPEQADVLWSHLDSCEDCLERLNEWFEAGNSSLTLAETETLPATFQSKLIRRINREEATRQMVSFGFIGLLTVSAFLFKSIFAIGSTKTRR